MSPKNTSTKLFARCLERKKKMNKNMYMNMKKMNKRNNRSKVGKLYLSYLERHSRDRVSYVVRSIKINHLLGPPPAAPLRPKKAGFKAGLPSGVGCGVFGSSIVYAAGFTPATDHSTPSSTNVRDVYAFETESKKFIKMDAKLANGKIFPKMVELGGKLCALSSQSMSGAAFEVFDPEMNAWHELPKPPFWNHCSTSWLFNYAITGTKMFASYGSSPIYCFDIAQDNRNWRRVDSMSGPFNFDNDALVLDLPGHPNKKLMFGCSYSRRPHWKLRAYIMFLDEGLESFTEIVDCALPALPGGFDFAGVYYPLCIGGQQGCLVAPVLKVRSTEGERRPSGDDVVGRHKTTGVAVPFEFQVDFRKIDEDVFNCLTLEFKPSRVFEFYTSPSTMPDPCPQGCFIV